MTSQALTKNQPPTPEEVLEAVFNSHGVQQETMTMEYIKQRRKALANTEQELDNDQLEFDVREFLSRDESRRKAAMRLAADATNPIVSRETQLAILKQLVSDFYRGKKRPGLNAMTMLKAAELINKMTGYDAPIKQEINVEHKVNVLPIVGEAFKGELEPLRVVDVLDVTPEGSTTTSVALPEAEHPQPQPQPPQRELTPEDF